MKKIKLCTLLLSTLMIMSLTGCSSDNSSISTIQGEKGDKGDTGDNGVGIERVEKTATNDNIDTYTIYYSDGTTSTFTVTNGKNGSNGKDGINGKDGVDGTNGADGKDGSTPTITINDEGYWCVDGVSTGVKAQGENGKDGIAAGKGERGDDGVGISSVSYSYDKEGNTIVTINFTDNTSKEITIQKGEKGDPGKDGINGKDGQSLLTGNGAPSSSLGNNGDSYLDLDTWDYYTKNDGGWTKTGNIKGGNGSNGSDGKDGDKGDKGDAGISITDTKIDANGDLIVYFSDGSTKNAGHVKDVDEEKYTVHFYVADDLIKTLVVNSDTKISMPTEEETTGYVINKWQFNEYNTKYDWLFTVYEVNQDVDLYADYVANKYTVSFTDSKFNNLTDSIEVTYGSDYSFTQFKGIAGYTHTSWMSDDMKNYSFNGKWKTPYDISLNAHWDNNKYDITLDVNKGTLSETTIKVTYDESYSLPTPTRKNYNFLGWYDSEDKKVSQKANWKRTQNETLTAKWTNVQNTYTFDAGNGTCSVDSMVIGWEDKWELPTPIYKNDKATYKFTGWYLGNVLIPQTGDSWTYTNKGGTLVAKWAVVSYKTGNYPQTKITDESLISTLNSKAGTLPTLDNSYNWHYVDYYDDYSNNNPTKNMWYQDISIKSNKYRGVYFTKYRDGNEYQKDNLYYLNTIYWFKYEPILWRGLLTSSSNVMLVSEQLLDVQAFYPETYSNPQDINKSITYEYSYIREWLNNDFYNCAFTIDEKKTIEITNVDNSISTMKQFSSTYKTWNNTNDNVFLLSFKDAKIYFSDDNDRIASPTDYAECLGIWKSSIKNYKSLWITRSPEWHYTSTSFLSMINYDGSPSCTASPSKFNGIRPAITLTL